jgi:hypothetical protein
VYRADCRFGSYRVVPAALVVIASADRTANAEREEHNDERTDHYEFTAFPPLCWAIRSSTEVRARHALILPALRLSHESDFAARRHNMLDVVARSPQYVAASRVQN